MNEAISLLLEAISLYSLSLGPFHPRLGYALSCLARAYAMSGRGGGGVPGRGGDGTADGVADCLADGTHHTHRLAVLQRLAHIRSLASDGSGASQLASRQLELTSHEMTSHGPRAARLASVQAGLSRLERLEQLLLSALRFPPL